MSDEVHAKKAIDNTRQWVVAQKGNYSLDDIVHLLCIQVGAESLIDQRPAVMIVKFNDGSGVGVHRKGLDLLESIPVTTKRARNNVSLTAYWGNDDASSTITISEDKWKFIQYGGHHIEHSISWYEGDSEVVVWTFSNRHLSIDGEYDRQCVQDEPLSELYVEE